MLPAVRIASVNSKRASARLLKNAWSHVRNARRLASGVCSPATDFLARIFTSGSAPGRCLLTSPALTASQAHLLINVLDEDHPVGPVEPVGVHGEVAADGRCIGSRGQLRAPAANGLGQVLRVEDAASPRSGAEPKAEARKA